MRSLVFGDEALAGPMIACHGATSSTRRQGRIGEGFRCRALDQTAAAWRNGAFVFHMAWRMTASLRATLTFAFLKPAPLAILRPQAFREEKPVCRVRMHWRLHRGRLSACRRASRCGYADLKVSRNTLCNGDDLACSIKATCDLRLPDLDAALACVVYAHSDWRGQRAAALSA